VHSSGSGRAGPRHTPSRSAKPDGIVLVFALSLSPLFDALMELRVGRRRGPHCRTARSADARFAAEPSACEALLDGARSRREIRQRGGRIHASRSDEPLPENVVNRQTDLYIYLSMIARCSPRAPLSGEHHATRSAEQNASDVPVSCRARALVCPAKSCRNLVFRRALTNSVRHLCEAWVRSGARSMQWIGTISCHNVYQYASLSV
jgi:hypothetical protein